MKDILIFTGVIALMVFMHKKGWGCCGGHNHGKDHDEDISKSKDQDKSCH